MGEIPLIWIDEIKNDRSSGASELAGRAVRGFVDWVQGLPKKRIESLREETIRLGLKLIGAQPVMVPLRQLVNQVLNGLEGIENFAHGKEAICQVALEFGAALGKSVWSIAEQTMELIRNGQVLLVHSYSSTLLAGLLRAREAGKRFEVICTESRPLHDGRYMAQKLAEAGVPVTLITDAAAFQFLPRADQILVGGDALTPAGLINKIGTRGLAMSACSKPFYALCGSEKFWPQPLPVLLENQTHEPQELWPQAPSIIRIRNFYFDQTPIKQLTAVIAQEDVLSPSEVLTTLREVVVHPSLIPKD